MNFHFSCRQLTPRIVLWEFHEHPSLDEWSAALARATEWLLDLERRGRRVLVVVDPSGMGNVDASIRSFAGEWRAQHLPLIANTCECAAYVADTPLVRGVLTAVFWFARPVIPVQIVASREEALAWVEARA